MLIPIAVWSKVWACGRTLAGIAGSNPAESWISVPCEYCVLSGVLRRASHSSCGVFLGRMCLSVSVIISKPEKWGGLSPLGLSSYEKSVLYKTYSSRSFDMVIFGTYTLVNLVIERVRFFSTQTPSCNQDSINTEVLQKYNFKGLYFKAVSWQDES
jgi:hypothetical protein